MTLFLGPLLFLSGGICALLAIAFWLRNLFFDCDYDRRHDAIGLGVSAFGLTLGGGLCFTFSESPNAMAVGLGAMCALLGVGGLFCRRLEYQE